MRLLTITAPFDRADMIVTTLYERDLASVTRTNGEVASVITCYLPTHSSGPVLHALDLIGCGSAYGRIALSPVELLKPLPKIMMHRAKVKNAMGEEEEEEEEAGPKEANMKARLAIEEIYTDVNMGSGVSFDYVAFVLIASAIAGLGLITNNTVMIVASMLVSPLMGPILAFTFGTVVNDKELIIKGIKLEIIGLSLSFVVGLFVGIGGAVFAKDLGWPTNEMESRGNWGSILIGACFAIPSGAGVALSVTSGGGNSLVGVAIAAALLPPVVNTGICLTFSIIAEQFYDDDFDSAHFLKIGGISFLLFMLNVLFIYVIAVAVFRFKGIRPIRRQLLNWQDIPHINTDPDRLTNFEDNNRPSSPPTGSPPLLAGLIREIRGQQASDRPHDHLPDHLRTAQSHQFHLQPA